MADFYMKRGDQQFGPYKASRLKQHADDGRVLPSDLIRQGEEGKWYPASSVKGLFSKESVRQSADAQDATSELDPEDHPLTKVRWDNPVVSSTCVLPPHESADRKALFYSRDEEMSNRASVVLEASLVRCVGALILWGVACYALALSARCLMYGKCQVMTPPPSFPE